MHAGTTPAASSLHRSPGSSAKRGTAAVVDVGVVRAPPSTLGRRITVKSLDASTDLAALAADIVDKCKLIHPSKVGRASGAVRAALVFPPAPNVMGVFV